MKTNTMNILHEPMHTPTDEPRRVKFTKDDGTTFVLDGVLIDLIGPTAMATGVIGIELEDGRLLHAAHILFWEGVE